MSTDVTHSVTVQFLVQGMGSDEDFERRVELERVLGDALAAANNGECTGGDGGSGTMNVFLTVSDPERGRATILRALEKSGALDEVVVAHHADREEDEDADEEVWWPEDYPYRFTVFGPMWKGPLPEAELRKLDGDLRALQGRWRVTRYDMPGDSSASEWAKELEFLFVRDRLTVRHRASVVSDAHFRLAGASPNHMDMYPTLGPNKGIASQGIYELTGDGLQLCVVPPGEPRPTAFASAKTQQVGRMVLRREGS
jgi:uncharacterized protein (TIGR03067 family)